MATYLLAVNEIGRRVGESHHRAKLTNLEVELVLQFREEGWTYERIAQKFEVSKSQIRYIIKGMCRAQFPVAFRTVHTND